MHKYSYVFDLNEKYLRCGLFVLSSATRVCHKKTKRPQRATGAIVAREMFSLINDINRDRNVEQKQMGIIGICLPDETDKDYNGLMEFFHCEGVSFKELFLSFFDNKVPVVMLKKTHVTPFAPRRMYPNKNHSMYAIHLGEKIKGGFTNRNEIGTGYRFMAGDIGEMSLLDDDNKSITLNEIASNGEMIRYASELIETENSLLGDGRKITMKEIYQAAQINDPVALKVVLRTATYVAKIAAQIALVLDPQNFIINDGNKANYQLHELVSEEYKKYAHEDYKNIPYFVLNGKANEHFFGMAQYLRQFGDEDGRAKVIGKHNSL